MAETNGILQKSPLFNPPLIWSNTSVLPRSLIMLLLSERTLGVKESVSPLPVVSPTAEALSHLAPVEVFR